MEHKYVDLPTVCTNCQGELGLTAISVDLTSCSFIVICSCIVCGHGQDYILSVADFIEINQIFESLPH